MEEAGSASCPGAILICLACVDSVDSSGGRGRALGVSREWGRWDREVVSCLREVRL